MLSIDIDMKLQFGYLDIGTIDHGVQVDVGNDGGHGRHVHPLFGLGWMRHVYAKHDCGNLDQVPQGNYSRLNS